jgi:endo-1,4-beta-xylanase
MNPRHSQPHRVTLSATFAFAILALGSPFVACAAADADTTASLPLLPAPAGVPQPASKTDAPYAPQPILAGGVVIPLYPPDSPYLNQEKIREPEVYQFWGPHQLGAIVSIHNPSIEFHPGHGQLNTGAAIILAAGGGHNSLNVGSEGAPFVPFFANHGVSTIILRNRLRSDGYDPRVDGANDALQAIKLVRAYAKEWKLDPNKIGIMGFSAGAELAAFATMNWEEFDQKNDLPGNPLAKISSRPDFAGIIYPGPTPFARGGNPPIPRAAPPAFIASAGWGDWIHAVWANEYFTALLNDSVPNVEMHIYARGHHPGDKVGPDEPPATGGLANMGGIAFGSWSARFLDWFRDLGFLNKPGVVTQAAKDVAANLDRKRRSATPPPRPTAAPKS